MDCRASHLFTTYFITKKFIPTDKSLPNSLSTRLCSLAAGCAFCLALHPCFLRCPCWSTVSLHSLTAIQYSLELADFSENSSKNEEPNMQLSKTGLINPSYTMGLCVYRVITLSSNSWAILYSLGACWLWDFVKWLEQLCRSCSVLDV